MSTHPDIIKFLTLFEKVKEITGGNPSQIPIRARNNKRFKALCDELWKLHFFLGQRVRDAGDTIIPNVQRKYIEQRNLYEREYGPYIGNVSFVHEMLVSDGILSDAPRAPEVSEEVAHENDLHEAREQSDGIRLRLELGSWERNNAHLTEELSDQLYKGEHDLNRQIISLGLDFEKLIFRELQLRTVHVPTHSSKDATDPLSLVSFLQEAHRAFRLGLTLATIGMCRAISDILIRDHYRIAPDEKVIKRRFELAKADSIASQKGIDTELHALFDYGSEVLHGRPGRARDKLLEINIPETATLEEVALHWLKKLVKIVEGVPEK
jgi:hypothetical protein